MFIDTHCHLNFQAFKDDYKQVITRAKKAGVKKFICPGAYINTSRQAIKLAHEFKGVVFASVGIHPCKTLKITSIEREINNLTPFFKHKPVAIGECGLDYKNYTNFDSPGKKSLQKQLFASQLMLAKKHSLPVIIHCRQAFDDLFKVLYEEMRMPAGVLHCFSGGLQDVRAAVRIGLFIGIDGNVTYSRKIQEIVPHIPLTHLLLETDSPYITPIPYRGKRNEPKYILLTAKKLAQLYKTTISEIEKQTARNAEKLFRI